jgi:glutamate-5-semialdehyde dehydrogenase
MQDKQTYLEQGLAAARRASRDLARCDDQLIRNVLNALADRAIEAGDAILAANRSDLDRMPREDPKYDRLLLNDDRLRAICEDLRCVAALPSPVGEVLEHRTLDNGLELSKVRVPMGVIAVIFESRPNVTFDVFALCLKTRNACVLKGSSDAHDTNRVVVDLMHEVLEQNGVNPDAVFLAPPEREWLPKILQAVGTIDLAIPRGSKGLIDFVRDNARIPVIETGAGIVHSYVDASADLNKARAIITNAKTRRVSVCNALDTLVIHRALLPELPGLMREMGENHGVEVFADEDAYAALDGAYEGSLEHADERHFGQEFLSLRLSIKTVAGLDEALDHIHRYSSKHSEAIIAESPTAASSAWAPRSASARRNCMPAGRWPCRS